MSVLATDNFNRADASTLGANWSSFSTTSRHAIVSNQCKPSSSAGLFGDRYTAVSAPSDQYSKVTIAQLDSVTDNGLGPAVRMDTAGAMTLYLAQPNTHEIRLYKAVAGSFTQLGTDAAAPTVGDIIEIRAQGTSISVLKNGSTVIGPVTDSDIASGSWGLWTSDGGATQGIIDNWEGGDFSGASTVAMEWKSPDATTAFLNHFRPDIVSGV